MLTVTLDSATGAYTVTQNAPIDHPNGNDENNVEFALTYRVTDRDGVYEDGTLKINVDDDSPTSAYVLKSGILLTADKSDGLQNAVTTPSAPGDANDEDTAAAFPVSVINPGSDSRHGGAGRGPELRLVLHRQFQLRRRRSGQHAVRHRR